MVEIGAVIIWHRRLVGLVESDPFHLFYVLECTTMHTALWQVLRNMTKENIVETTAGIIIIQKDMKGET